MTGSMSGAPTASANSPSKARLNNEFSNFNPSLHQRRNEERAMARDKIYCIDAAKMLEDFFPKRSGGKAIPNIFSGGAPKWTSESKMYSWITETLETSGLCPGRNFVATPYKSDPLDSSDQAVDCGMYEKKFAPTPSTTAKGEESRRMNWSRVELSIECKVGLDSDPFDESRPNCVPRGSTRQGVLGQVLTYAELVFKYQHREFHYTVIFLGHYARIIRFDRSGITITPRLHYTEAADGKMLSTFFARYGRMLDTNRGHDPTAVRIEEDDPLRASVMAHIETLKEDPSDKVRRFRESLEAHWPWWKLEVHDEFTNRIQSVVVGKPTFLAPGVVGRGTRGYIGLPIDAEGVLAEELIHIKDAWRIAHDSFQKEGDILKELNKAEVPYVPTVLYHGDLPGQTAKSYDNWREHFGGSDTKAECPLKPHQHYRLVVKEVGKPLSEFTDGYHLVSAIFAVLQAHEAACRAGYLHRDISAGNILLFVDADGELVGMLNDWELAKEFSMTDGPQTTCRQLDRTGTWQFMSANALNNPAKIIGIADDLESIFHVLVYFALRFLPSNAHEKATQILLFDYFDHHSDGNDGFTCGPMKFSAMTTGSIEITLVTGTLDRKKLVFYHSPSEASSPTPVLHPIDKLISTFLGWFRDYYSLHWAVKSAATPQAKVAPKSTRTASKVVLKLDKSLKDLPGASSGKDHIRPLPEQEPAIRMMVETHGPMKLAFNEALSGDNAAEWPDNDKGKDKRSTEYVPPTDNKFQTSQSLATKRPLEDAGKEGGNASPSEPASKSKRSRRE